MRVDILVLFLILEEMLFTIEHDLSCRFFLFNLYYVDIWDSQVELVVNNLPANAGDVKDTGLIAVSGRSPWRSACWCMCLLWLPRWFSGKESTCQAGDVSLISGLERSSGEVNGKYSCLWNLMDKSQGKSLALWARVHWVTKEWDTT